MPDNFSQGLQQELTQRHVLSQQHLKYVKLLELNSSELEEAVERELTENPALETEEEAESKASEGEYAIPYYLQRANNSSPDDNRREFIPADESDNLYDFLVRQIDERTLPEDVAETARYLAGSVDSNGYIRRPLNKILEDLEFNHDIVVAPAVAEEALKVVKSLEPAGVGASDLKETLSLQLQRLPASTTRDNAIRILNEKFDEFTMRHYHKIMSGLGLNRQETLDAVEMIQGLNPKPGAQYSSTSEDFGNVIIPDFIVENHDGSLNVQLNNRIPELKVEQSFEEAVDTLKRTAGSRKSRKGSEFITSRFNDARDFIKSLSQRQQTMMEVMTAIVQLQHDYFVTEDVDRMKPMMIKDIAKITGLDPSTISRATNNKFVETGWGIFPLRHFFSDTIGDDEDGLTNRRIEAEIVKMVEEEDKRHPLSDEKICQALNAKGYDVSRRTVAKYRDRKRIPVARLRKEI